MRALLDGVDVHFLCVPVRWYLVGFTDKIPSAAAAAAALAPVLVCTVHFFLENDKEVRRENF